MTDSCGILVVDDESESLVLLADILAGEGYHVRPANSGRLALASVTTWLPELILLDIRMPGTDGFEVCRRFKANNRTKNIPVMFISGASDVKERLAGFALGAVDYITKPFQREELLARVRTHLELARLRARLEDQVQQRTVELQATVERLRESEERFRNMADTAPVMIWVSGADRRRTFLNKAWLTFTGQTMDQGHGDGWVESVHPDDLDRCLATHSMSFASRQEFHIEYRLRRSDGEYRWVLDNGVPRFASGGGTFAGYIGSTIDITDLKRNQEQAMAKQKLESLGALTRGIAHDFNNLMGSILAEAELADSNLAEGSSPGEELRQIKAVAIHGSEIVRELMIFSGQEKVKTEAVNLSLLVEEMLGLLNVYTLNNAALHIDLDRNLPAVRGNVAQIRRLVMNLIINASQALGDKAGVITVRTARAIKGRELAASRSSNAADDFIRLEVSDTGCGMTESEKARMFDPFFTTKPGGHGLGLSVVHGIVRSHGGSINVASAPGKGTAMEIMLPCAKHGVETGPLAARAVTAEELPVAADLAC